MTERSRGARRGEHLIKEPFQVCARQAPHETAVLSRDEGAVAEQGEGRDHVDAVGVPERTPVVGKPWHPEARGVTLHERFEDGPESLTERAPRGPEQDA